MFISAPGPVGSRTGKPSGLGSGTCLDLQVLRLRALQVPQLSRQRLAALQASHRDAAQFRSLAEHSRGLLPRGGESVRKLFGTQLKLDDHRAIPGHPDQGILLIAPLDVIRGVHEPLPVGPGRSTKTLHFRSNGFSRKDVTRWVWKFGMVPVVPPWR